MGEWQPIGTAPKDGTSILVADLSGNVALAYWGHWSLFGDDWLLSDPGQFGEPGLDFEPIHWTALPTLPSTAKAGENQK